jgi:proton glutamate symport protein
VPPTSSPASPASPAPNRAGVIAILALVAGFILGALVRAASERVAQGLLVVADPVGTLWVNAIRMTVIPLVVSLLITGIVQSTDSRSVGRLGVRAVAVFVVLLCMISILSALLAPPIFSFLQVDPAGAAALRASVAPGATAVPELPGIAAWITSLVPVNPVQAAVNGAMLPLIVFTFAFGLAMRYLPDRERDVLAGFFRAVADAMLVLVRWVLWLAPLGIAALALSLGARLGVSAAGAVGFYLVVHAALLVVAIAVLYVVAVGLGRVSLGTFARAALPAQIVAMSTRSSLAALPAMLDAAETRLGLSRQTTGFVVPFAVSVFRLNLAVSWIVGGLFVAKLYDVPFGLPAIVTFTVAAVVMSFSVPGIPSGSLFIIAPLFPTVGLPVEGVGILIALDALPDVFKTALNVTGHLTSAVLLSRDDRSRATTRGGAAVAAPAPPNAA